MSQRNITCKQCGAREQRGGKAQRSGLCHACGIERSAAVQREMHAHDGESWDNYVATGQVLGRTDQQCRGPDGRYLPRTQEETNDH